MSVSFSDTSSIVEDFDPNSFVRNLCVNTQVEILFHVNARFPSGWKGLIEEFINSIKSYPIRISSIYDTYSVLDIRFEMENLNMEVYVWRAIDKARSDSAITCVSCGGEMAFRKRMNPLEMLCDSCRKTRGKLGKTQTWLDKY